ncbi:MAG: peroxiredoxin [Alphaproteobacteria bacterium]|nr:peroxiredoxin [Alphaproteobacteria bacterium]
MARKLIIVMVNSDPRNGEELGAPFHQAAAAAALDYEVEVVLMATAGRLLKKGVAAGLTIKPGATVTVYDLMRQAHEAGARFFGCSANLELFDMTEDDLIPECAGLVGSAYLMRQVMEDDVRVLTY